MNLLAFDTATEQASIALYIGQQGQYYESGQLGVRSHAHALLDKVENLLQQAQLTLSALDGIVFGRGPGSFTGLRVACSIAKGLGYGLNLPLYPVSTLAAVIEETRVLEAAKWGDNVTILAVMDARMQQVYWASASSGIFEEKTLLEQVSDPAEVMVPGSKPIILAGVGLETYEALWSPALQSRIVKQSPAFPKASAMIRLVLQQQILPVDAEAALPVYIRDQIIQGTKNG